MSSAKRGRYIRRNAADYILITLAILLLLSIGARFIAGKLNERTDRTCSASVSFVLRGLESDEAARLVSAAPIAFSFSDNGSPLALSYYVKQAPTPVTVENADGSLSTVPSESKVDVYFAFVGEGAVAKDGGFLLRGVRRLAAGDRFSLSFGDGRYEGEFLRVQIS